MFGLERTGFIRARSFRVGLVDFGYNLHADMRAVFGARSQVDVACNVARSENNNWHN